jgi:hypothetical protein
VRPRQVLEVSRPSMSCLHGTQRLIRVDADSRTTETKSSLGDRVETQEMKKVAKVTPSVTKKYTEISIDLKLEISIEISICCFSKAADRLKRGPTGN